MKTYADTLKERSKHVYTSAEILETEELYDLQELHSSGIDIKYQLTEAEYGWLEFINKKYCIADFIYKNLDNGDYVKNNPGHSSLILTITEELSLYLDADNVGWGKATMLSDDTALQKIFFWLYQETEETELKQFEKDNYS